MSKVVDLDRRANDLGINYEKEIGKSNVYKKHFSEFSRLVDSISQFSQKFGDKKKLVKTLEEKYEMSKTDYSSFDKF